MKKFLTVLLLVACILCFGACNNAIEISQEENQASTNKESIYSFLGKTQVDENNIIYTFYHKETKVMYMFFYSFEKGGLVVMLNEDGKPLLYQGN